VSTLAQAELHTEHLNKHMAREIQSKTGTEREKFGQRAGQRNRQEAQMA